LSTDIWNREELYADVWETPLTKLTAKYGVSAYILRNVCRKLQIPVPPSGYWIQKEFGKSVERAPLPEIPNLPMIERKKTILSTEAKSEQNTDDPELLRIAQIEGLKLLVNPDIKHQKLVATAARLLKHSSVDDRGILKVPRNEPCLEIRVSKALLERALAIMGTIILELEKNGFPVSIQNIPQGTVVEVFGNRVPFCLVERARVRGQKEIKEFSWTRRVVDYEPTGELEFRIEGYGDGVRRVWRDGKAHRLENLLSGCVAALMREGRQRRIGAELAKQREIEAERRRKELEILAQQIKEEEEKVRALDGWVTNWIRAGQMRSFIDALEKVWAQQGHDVSPEAAKGQRIAWMKQQADRLDPMIPSPPSIIDRKNELPRW
jgi:hypothetical protein